MKRSPLRWALAGVAVLVLAPLAVYLVPQVVGGDVAYAVLSGSMEPTFAPGDYIVSEKFRRGDPIEVGDVITYRSGSVLVTHRVLEVQGTTGARNFVTQGDANANPDPRPVPEGLVVAVYRFAVPLYGHVPIFAAQPLGRLLLIVVPAATVMVLEGRKLARLLSERAAPPPAAAAPAAPPAAPPAAVLARGPASAAPTAPPARVLRPATAPTTGARFQVVRRGPP